MKNLKETDTEEQPKSPFLEKGRFAQMISEGKEDELRSLLRKFYRRAPSENHPLDKPTSEKRGPPLTL